jgi:hypothetical protein
MTNSNPSTPRKATTMKRITTPIITLVAGLAFAGNASADLRSTTPAPLPTVHTAPGSDSLAFNDTNVIFELAPDSGRDSQGNHTDPSTCQYAPSPLTLQIWPEGGSPITATLADQCQPQFAGGEAFWSPVSINSNHIAYSGGWDWQGGGLGWDGHSPDVTFTKTGRYGYNLYQGATLATTGWVDVRQDSEDNLDVYEWVNGVFNDQFINICIDHGYTLYSADHGNLYCRVARGHTWYPVTIHSGPMPPTPPTPPTPPPVVTPKAPKITAHSASRTKSQTAAFRFTDSTRGVTFKCRLDKRGPWHACKSARYTKLARNRAHTFEVSATLHGKTSKITRFAWKVTK